MTWIRRADTDGHACSPPMTEQFIKSAALASGRVAVPGPGDVAGSIGDLWRCDQCRKLWRVGRACAYCDAYGNRLHHGWHAMGRQWRPATTWQRIRWWRR